MAQGREGRQVAVPEAPAAEADVPVGELVHEGGDLAPGAGAVEAVHVLADARHGGLQAGQGPAIELARGSGLVADRGEVEGLELLDPEALGVRVEHPEGVGVPEGQEELADGLADRVHREAVAGPGLL